MAQHGEPKLHPKVHQALERRLVHAGDDPEGTNQIVLKGESIHPDGSGVSCSDCLLSNVMERVSSAHDPVSEDNPQTLL